jgi:hypothetical protein
MTAVALTACGSAREPSLGEEALDSDLTLTSPVFGEGDRIPQRYTCDGADVSPPLSWSGAPAGTVSFALIVDDPDAPVGTWVHWVLFNIPADQRGLGEDLPAGDRLDDGSIHGRNGWGNLGYGGPCPPPGSTHEYAFKLYALDTMLELDPGAKKRAVTSAIEGHLLGHAILRGTYSRE